MLKRIFNFSNLTLLVALILSTIAAWYSIIGLTTIFAGAVIPVIIMGSALELAKITTTVWLRKYWHRAGLLIKLYLVPAVMAIALITSMGIFGFLSKAHMDQGVTSGDIQSKIAIYDEKIKTEKENIEANRKALKQMDEGVDQVLGRSTTETGAEKAVAMRKSQQKERTRLQNEILQSQKSIAGLNNERAPIAAEVRKVEAEVGPIKYIAALIYGDNPDSNILERAVRWVIILIVIVFDPLALCLILASQQSLRWAREDRLAAKEEEVAEDGYKTPWPTRPPIPGYDDEYVKWPGGQSPLYEPDDGPLTDEQIAQIKDVAKPDLPTGETVVTDELFPAKEFDINDHPYLFTPRGSDTPPGIEPVGPQVYRAEPSDTALEPCYKCGTPLINAPGIGPFCPNKACDVVDGWALEGYEPIEIKITMPVVEKQFPATMPTISATPIKSVVPEYAQKKQKPPPYVPPEAAHSNKKTIIRADNDPVTDIEINAYFGTEFPKNPGKGDLYLRVDYLPTRLYRYNNNNWMEIEKSTTDTYSYNEEYIKYLIDQLASGTYDPDDLTASEKEQIEEYISKNDQSSNNPA